MSKAFLQILKSANKNKDKLKMIEVLCALILSVNKCLCTYLQCNKKNDRHVRWPRRVRIFFFLRENLCFFRENLYFFKVLRENLDFFRENLDFLRENLGFFRENLDFFKGESWFFLGRILVFFKGEPIDATMYWKPIWLKLVIAINMPAIVWPGRSTVTAKYHIVYNNLLKKLCKFVRVKYDNNI